MQTSIQIETGMTIENNFLHNEWITLQNNYEQYEKIALLIKLTSIVLFSLTLKTNPTPILVNGILLVLWLQESIFKTYQSRLGIRLLRIETLIKQDKATENSAFQLHTEWLEQRKGVMCLILEYLKHAIKPTVAFPYAVLILIYVAIYSF